MPVEGNIVIRGARVNNLKDITVEIPRNRFVVITGISGSGKSSLAFDTLFAEGQRRFAESLSSYARQFLGRMSKPDVESIEGIPPAIAIEQKAFQASGRVSWLDACCFITKKGRIAPSLYILYII